MKNWKTTVIGIAIAITGGLASQHVITPEIGTLIGAILAGLFGFVSKDHNVTGGTVEQPYNGN